jgi:hypothetical protein
VLVVAAGIAGRGPHAALANPDTTIDTFQSWDGAQRADSFGVSALATYGQTVTVPTNGDQVLTSFTFYMQLPATVAFRGEVYA